MSAACISRLPAMPATGGSQPLIAAIRAGLTYLRRTPELRMLAAGMATYNFAYNVSMATFVLYATSTLHVADAGYGILLAVAAVGGILTEFSVALAIFTPPSSCRRQGGG